MEIEEEIKDKIQLRQTDRHHTDRHAIYRATIKEFPYEIDEIDEN